MCRLLLLMLCILSWPLTSCGSQSATPAESVGKPVAVEGGHFTRIDADQLDAMLKNKDFFFVNTHIPYEGEIAETDAEIPFDQTLLRLNEYPTDKNAKIVLYCRSGRMSTEAAGMLVKAGYTNVWELQGGMQAWRQAGYQLKTGGK